MNRLIQAIKGEYTFKRFIEQHPSIILLVDPVDGAILYANNAALNFYGYENNEIINMNIDQINILDKKDIQIEMNRAKMQKRNYFEFVHKLKSGALKKVNVSSHPIMLEGVNILMSEITEINNYESNISEDLNNIIGESNDLIVIIRKRDHQIIYKTPRFVNEFDSKRTAFDFIRFENYLSVSSKKMWADSFESLSHSNGDIIELLSEQNNQEIILPYRFYAIAIKYEAQEVILVKLEEIIEYKRNNYEITTSYFSKIDKDLSSNIGSLICIEYSKEILDTSISRQIAALFQSYFSNLDWEYVILQDQICLLVFSSVEGEKWLISMHAFLAYLNQEVNLFMDNDYNLLHVGITVASEFSQLLFDDLNDVMQSFNLTEKNSIHISNKTENYYRWTFIKNEIRNAIINDELVLYKQDIYDSTTYERKASEFLVRWDHPQKGLIAPAEFIAYAESSGFIDEIDFWVIRTAFDYLSHLETMAFYYHINISTLTLGKKNFMPYINTLLLQYHFDVTYVVIEITESSHHNVDYFALKELKSKGFRLAIDDFGTGYSSFDRLKKLNVDWIKIDKSFIDGIFKNSEDVMILKAIISLSRNLGIEIIAEGVETKEQLEFLSTNKCNLIQGFFFSKPHALLEKDPIIQRIPNLVASNGEKAHRDKLNTDDNFYGIFDYFFMEAPVSMFLLDDEYKLINYNYETVSVFKFENLFVKESNFLNILFYNRLEYKRIHYCFMNALMGAFDDTIIERTLENQTKQIMRWHIKYMESKGLFMCVVTDITESYTKNEQLNDFKIAVEGINAAVLVVDAFRQIKYFNKAAEGMFLYIHPGDMEFSLDKCLINNQGPIMTWSDWEDLYSLKGFKKDSKYLNYDREECYCRINGYASSNSNIGQRKFVIMVQNIDSEKNLEVYNNSLKFKLAEQDKISTIGLLASGLIHEINNPLTSIINNYHFIKDNIDSFVIEPPSLRDEVLDVFNENGQGLELISDLIQDLKRFVYSDYVSEKNSVDLLEVISTVLNLAKAEYKYYAEVEVLYEKEDKFYAKGSSRKFKQIFMNLLINAAYAIKSKKTQNQGLIKFELLNVNEYIKIVITDDGCGMDEKTISNLFKPFFTTKPEGIGTGLGLTIVRDIIENEFGGSIEFTSELNVGTQVILMLKT